MPRDAQSDFEAQERCIELQAKRIAELETYLEDTLRAVLHHFGPEGANKVTATVIQLRSEKANRK